ncbi:MAG: 5-(carboxyamino)imidazole ribonucleotide synthase [Planctomycetota bacterium]
MSDPILPGATIGVLGGGQLGRMLGLAARRLGYGFAVFCPEPDSPAAAVADLVVNADYRDRDALRRFAEAVDVVTFEFENVPAETAELLESLRPVRPSGRVLADSQHRLREKRALRAAGIPTVDFAEVPENADAAALAAAVAEVGAPAILKTAAFGYDGKGQTRVTDAADIATAHARIGRQEAILEALAPFEREISVVAARRPGGEIALFEPTDNVHVNHILDVSVAPADLPDAVRAEARAIVTRLLAAWEVVGVLCVEMFLLPGGELVVNEVAPRPHNSGHLTMDSVACDQFEQQARAVCDLPLGDTTLRGGAAMANLLGDLWAGGEPDWAAALARPIALHLYGKTEARVGRKMGHINALAESPDAARAIVAAARDALRRR